MWEIPSICFLRSSFREEEFIFQLTYKNKNDDIYLFARPPTPSLSLSLFLSLSFCPLNKSISWIYLILHWLMSNQIKLV